MSVFKKHWQLNAKEIEEEVIRLNTSNMENNDKKPCREYHGINGVLPTENDLHFDGQTCDCGRIIFIKEMCTCPNNPHEVLKSRPNPNY